MNILSYLIGHSYSALVPSLRLTAAVCQVNGQVVECPQFVNFLGIALIPLVLGLGLLMIISAWKIFTKANQPGWASIIPVYNIVVTLQIIKRPIWWVILAFIPFVNFIVGIIIAYELAKAFGKGGGFTLGLIFLPFIFYPILGFGSAQYMQSAEPSVPTQPV